MLYDQDILLNFPRLYNPHARGAREYFYDYGTPLSVNIDPQQNNACINFVYQKNLSCNNTDHVLIPRGPCRPIIPPNPNRNINKEPCMHHLRELEEETDELLSFLNFFPFHVKVPKNEVIKMLKERLEVIKNNKKQTTSDDVEDFYVGDDKMFRCLAGIAKRHGNVFGDYNNIWKKSYNPRYAGGCLSFQALEGQKELNGVLFFPTGRNMSSLAFGTTYHENRSEMSLAANFEFSFDVGQRIYQVSTEMVKNRIFCLARTKRSYSFFELGEEEDGLKFVHLATSDWPKENNLSHVALSPHLMGEVLVSTEGGGVYLWALERSQREIFRVPTTTNPIEKVIEGYPTHAHFTGHPRCFVVSTADAINVVDARTANGTSSCLLKLSTNETFNRGETITCSHRPGPDSTHHFFASQLSLGLIDERFPDHVVLKWNHSFLSPPTFMDVLPSIMGIENETLITLASQDQGEVHCFQSHGVATPFDQLNPSPSKIEICGLPWRTCRPEEILTGSLRNVKKRLNCPLIGQCIVPNEWQKGFSIVQMTSIGDLFCQDYHGEQGSLKDSKTFPIPSQHLTYHDLDSFRELFADWLRECQGLPNEKEDRDDDDDDDFIDDNDCSRSFKKTKQMKKKLGDAYRNVINKDGGNYNYLNVNNNYDDNKRSRMDVSGVNTSTVSDEQFCQKCTTIGNNQNYDDVDDTKLHPTCLSCQERKFWSRLREDKVPPSTKTVDLVSITANVRIPPKNEDADGQILFAQYRDEEFKEFLKMRDEETIKDCKEVLKDCMPVDEDDDKSDLELANDVDDDDDDDY